MPGELGTYGRYACPRDFRVYGAGLEQAKLANRRIPKQVDLKERAIEHRADTINDGDRSTLGALDRNRRANVTDFDPPMACAAHGVTSTVGVPIVRPPLPPV